MALLDEIVITGAGEPMLGTGNAFDKINKCIESVNLITAANELATKVITMGAWDMQTDVSKSFAHGLSDITKITGVSIAIIRDDLAYSENLFGTPFLGSGQDLNRGAYRIDATNVDIDTFGYFSGPNFNSAIINRGYITIWYLK